MGSGFRGFGKRKPEWFHPGGGRSGGGEFAAVGLLKYPTSCGHGGKPLVEGGGPDPAFGPRAVEGLWLSEGDQGGGDAVVEGFGFGDLGLVGGLCGR